MVSIQSNNNNNNNNCKDPIWFLSLRVKRILAQKVQYNEFVESGLEHQALMNWTTIMVGLDNLKAKINRFYVKKIVLGTIRGDVFLYVSLLNLITSPIFVATMFFNLSSNPLSSGYYFSFILSSFFHLHPPRADQVAGIDPCSISTFLKSLGVAIRLKITVQVSLSH